MFPYLDSETCQQWFVGRIWIEVENRDKRFAEKMWRTERCKIEGRKWVEQCSFNVMGSIGEAPESWAEARFLGRWKP